jgi:3-deoxy-D-manno-octulosonic-acid transferase
VRLVYRILTMLLAPLAFALVVCRGVRDRSYWQGLGERFGFGSRVAASPSLCLHAVSLGEVSAAATLVRALRARYPIMPFVITTATPTGRARARELFGGEVEVRFLPYDTRGSMARFLRRVDPALLIIMETELWPNLLLECRRLQVPVVFASARLTQKSVSGYRRARRLLRAALAENAFVAAQTQDDAARFIEIGADAARTRVVGNVKFDIELGSSILEQGRMLRKSSFAGRPLWIAGSTHGGEEEQVLDAHAKVLRTAPNALLLLVPRHPQRFEAVANLLTRRQIVFDRRSAANSSRPAASVLLVDTVGELASLYAAVDVAFVGGSLVPVGGHNLLEPAALGVPVVTGPYNANSRDIARALESRGGAFEVQDAAALARVVAQLFDDAELRRRAGDAGREFVEQHRGSVARLLAIIAPRLASSRAPAANP